MLEIDRTIPLTAEGKRPALLVTFKGCDRIFAVRQNLTRPGKGGRLHKHTILYIGCDNLAEARAIRAHLFSHIPKFLLTTRHACRALDWQFEVKAIGDFDDSFIEEALLAVEDIASVEQAASPALV